MRHLSSAEGKVAVGRLSAAPLAQLHRLRVRLPLVFVLFLLLVIGLGAFSINRLSAFHNVAAEISGRWLLSNRIAGDLNNSISDFRATEGELLTARRGKDRGRAEGSLAVLDEEIADAKRRYETIEHDPIELDLYQQFSEQWRAYRELANRVLVLSQRDDKTEAIALYYQESRRAFSVANATLATLTERNVTGANEATQAEAVAYRHARDLIVNAIIVAALLMIAGVLYFVTAVTNPIAVLVDRMHRISDNETAIDIPSTERPDEVGEIARAVVRFRDNTVALAQSRATLAEQARTLEITLANERRMAELQRNFVSMVSHEFRTPLTVIDGYAQRLSHMKPPLSLEPVLDRSSKIRAAVRRMTALIEDMLGASQVLDLATPGAFQRTEFSLRLLVHEVCEMHRESSPDAQIVEQWREDVPEIFHGDARLLFQAVSNLIGNAVKYSPPKTPVSVDVSMESGAILICVADQGIGIPEKDLGHVFERYVRGANVTGTAGAGVGLYIVRLAAELHGGTVSVRSAEGTGSRFLLRLPEAPAPAPLSA
ncbi:ATP-binding protein [Cupriavidus metallidurans]|uniref:sensor histidine kinase n=1 Tax=Cupriavidus metallidurans TaxID=119219 RepID=UPI003B3A217E